MKRLSLTLFASALGLVAFGASQAHASYLYDWSTVSGSTVTLMSDAGEYKMTITNEPSRGPLVHGTDTTASQLSIFQVPNKPHGTDTIHGVFDLKLVITDQANGLKNDGLGGNLAPLVYHVTFTTTVNSDGSTSTSAVSLMPTTDAIILGSDTFTVAIPSTGQWFVAPPTVGSVNSGSVGLSIDFKTGNGGGEGPPPPAPEPSSMLLACLGLTFAGLSRWRKQRASSAELAV